MSARTLRLKRRYVIVKPSSEASLEDVSEAVRECFYELYGKTGLVDSGFKKGTIGSNLFLSCYKEWLPKLILAISLVRNLKNVYTVIRTVKVSGTIKGLRKAV